MSSKVLVTGGSGYLGTQLITALLREGQEVRATVRSLGGEAGVREAVRRDGADDTDLELVPADLTSDDDWPAALKGVEEVHHVASPIPSAQPKDPDELIVPAREGTVRVLKAARDAGARRVVLTSSFAAVGYSPKAVRDYTEADWTDPDTPGLPPYPRSKAIAERAAWDFIDTEGGDTQLVVVNPTFIAGPSLVPALRSSMTAFKAIIEGTMPALPRQRFGVVDVRDVVDAQISGDGYFCCHRAALPAAGGWPDDHLAGAGADPPRPPRACRQPGHDQRGAGRGPVAADDPQRPCQTRARLATSSSRNHDYRDRRQTARARPAGAALIGGSRRAVRRTETLSMFFRPIAYPGTASQQIRGGRRPRVPAPSTPGPSWGRCRCPIAEPSPHRRRRIGSLTRRLDA